MKASTWWSLVERFIIISHEYVRKAQAAELAETGHECGHRFQITVRAASHGILHRGESRESHTDSDHWVDPLTLTVRAHDLPTALLIASGCTLDDWEIGDES